jgi:Flp pilus assembly protein CpaB
VGWVVTRTVADADAASAAWTRGVPVVVAARDLEPGDALRADDVLLVERPRALVPTGALEQVPDGQVVRAAVFEGEVLVGARLAPAGSGALAASLPEGTRAVAIPVEPDTSPPLQPGDLVDILVALAEETAGSGPPGFVLARAVPVVDVGDHAVTVAVDRDVAPRVAVALGHGAITLALVAA